MMEMMSAARTGACPPAPPRRVALARATSQAREAECRRLARELHDELGATLTAIQMEALCLETPDGADDAAERARAIRELAQEACQTVRRMMRRVSAWGVQEGRLGDALERLAEEWRRRMPRLEVHLDVAFSQARVGGEASLAAYRLVQEAMTNAVRHGAPRRVEIRVRQAGRALMVSVADDGAGADPLRVTPGLGLTGARERASALGGAVSWSTAPGLGFRVEARVPLAVRRAA